MCRRGVGRAKQAWGLLHTRGGANPPGLKAFSLPHRPVFPLATVSCLVLFVLPLYCYFVAGLLQAEAHTLSSHRKERWVCSRTWGWKVGPGTADTTLLLGAWLKREREGYLQRSPAGLVRGAGVTTLEKEAVCFLEKGPHDKGAGPHPCTLRLDGPSSQPSLTAAHA